MVTKEVQRVIFKSTLEFQIKWIMYAFISISVVQCKTENVHGPRQGRIVISVNPITFLHISGEYKTMLIQL